MSLSLEQKKAVVAEVAEVRGPLADDRFELRLGSASVANVGGEVFQIATSREMTVKELVDAMLPILESRGVGPVETTYGERRVGDVQRSYADTRKARQRLGWCAEVSVSEGLTRTVAWFQERTEARAR